MNADHFTTEALRFARRADGTNDPAGNATPTRAFLPRCEGEPAPLGWYDNAAAARAHCEGLLSSEHPAGTALLWDWIEDEEAGVAELAVTVGKAEESPTGYSVITLELQSAYDPEADW